MTADDDARRARRQTLLHDLAVGDRDADDAEVRTMMREDAAFARDVRGVFGVRAALEARARAEREAMSQAMPAEEDAVERAALRLSAAARAQRLRRQRNLAVAVAAALMIAVGLLWWSPWRAPAPEWLGGTLPITVVEDGRALQFGDASQALAAGSYLRVRVLNLNGRDVVGWFIWRELTWRPGHEQTSTWPTRVVVEAVVFDHQRTEQERGRLEWVVRQ